LKKGYTYNFIFSKVFFYRVQRHLAFWVTRLLCLAFSETIYNSDVGVTLGGAIHYFFIQLTLLPLKSIPPELFYCYTVVYYLVPKFLVKKKYWSFIFSLTFITMAIVFFALIMSYYRLHWSELGREQLFAAGVSVIRVVLIFRAPTVAIFFLAIKMFKTWYLKQQEKQMLVKANADAEIQLLKAQIHPHFFFNTLNNIYSFTLDKSAKARELVLQLSDMLHYMITDCKSDLVYLDKEIKVLSDYIGLEKVRYGNRLNIETRVVGNGEDKLIAPLLMIPFVENSFKHGTSKMLENPWIRMNIEIGNDSLLFELSNSKPHQNILNGKKGIGLNNVQKRLELLYSKKYFLKIDNAEKEFGVQLRIPLHTDHIKNKAVHKAAKTSLA